MYINHQVCGWVCGRTAYLQTPYHLQFYSANLSINMFSFIQRKAQEPERSSDAEFWRVHNNVDTTFHTLNPYVVRCNLSLPKQVFFLLLRNRLKL